MTESALYLLHDIRDRVHEASGRYPVGYLVDLHFAADLTAEVGELARFPCPLPRRLGGSEAIALIDGVPVIARLSCPVAACAYTDERLFREATAWRV